MSRKKGFYKFDNVTMSRMVELSSLGYSRTEIAQTLGVHRNTITRWVNRYNLEETMRQAEYDLAQGTIKRALRQLAEGGESIETVTHHTETDDNGVERQVTTRVKKDAPSHKAVEIYARRYDKSFTQDVIDDTKNQVLTLNVNHSAMSLRELQQDAVHNNNPLGALDTTCHEVKRSVESNESNTMSLREVALSLDPPQEDSE